MIHHHPTRALVLATLLSLLGSALVFLGERTFAQTTTAPNLVLLWTAEEVMLPKAYPGRPLPTPGSTLRVSALLLPTSAQTPDLEYRWFVDERLARREANLKSITLIPPTRGGLDLRVEIRRVGELLGSGVVKIPVVEPQLTVTLAEYGVIRSGMDISWREQLNFRVTPLFFPRRQNETVALQWIVDGSPIPGEEGQKENLSLELAPGDLRPLRIEIEAQNIARPSIQAHTGASLNLVNPETL